MEKLLLIDGANMVNRAYFATKDQMKPNDQGLYTNAVQIVLMQFMKLMRDIEPSHLAVCWDGSRSNTFRKKVFPEYKATRPDPEIELLMQIDIIQLIFEKMNVLQFTHESFEADDVLGSIAEIWKNQMKGTCYIFSNDKDLYQLLHQQVEIINFKNGEIEYFTKRHFEQKYKVTPEQWVDIKAILGENGDNIPGVRMVGEKAAFPLIQQFGSLERLYDNVSLLEDSPYKRYLPHLNSQKDKAFLSKQLAKIVTNVPTIQQLHFSQLGVNINGQALIKSIKDLRMTTLLENIKKGKYRKGA